MITALCRDCGEAVPPGAGGGNRPRCSSCRSPRILRHPELGTLSLAHIDCDAFYATIEKRDAPELIDRPVIVGGATRGVVSAACYHARSFGVRSAMPMFKALQLCPHAAVVRPDMAKYSEVGRRVRTLMLELTPLVEPVSIDEAFLDLAGTEALHGATPAQSLARLARRIEQELGITVSVGLSYNKSLAKIASDLDKPKGFAVLGRADAVAFLSSKPVDILWGVGKALKDRLERSGIRKVGDLHRFDERQLVRQFGSIGRRLHALSHGRDDRAVSPERETKSVSSETTFNADTADPETLARTLWPLAESVARRLARAGLGGSAVVLKLKTKDFVLRTRRTTLASPTLLADTIWRAVQPLLAAEIDGTAFRLVGVGVENLVPAERCDPPDLLDEAAMRRAATERVMEEIRDKLGRDAITKGRGLETPATVVETVLRKE